MRCAVLGDPIAHSLSPVLHRAAYDATGLDWTYDAVRVPAGGLADAPRPALDAIVARALADDAAQARGDAARRHGLSQRAALVGRGEHAGPGRRRGARRQHRPAGRGGRAPGAVRRPGHRRPPSWEPARPPRRSGWRCATSGRARCCCSSATPSRAAETVAAIERHPDAPRSRWGRSTDGRAVGEVLVSTIPADAQDDALVARCADAGGGLRRGLRPVADAAGRGGGGSGAGQRARPARAPGGAAVLDLHRLPAPLERMRDAGLEALG